MTPFRPIEEDAPHWPQLRRLLDLALPKTIRFVRDGKHAVTLDYGPLQGFLTHLYPDQYAVLSERVDNAMTSVQHELNKLDVNQFMYQIMDDRLVAEMNCLLETRDYHMRSARLPTLVEILRHEFGLEPHE